MGILVSGKRLQRSVRSATLRGCQEEHEKAPWHFRRGANRLAEAVHLTMPGGQAESYVGGLTPARTAYTAACVRSDTPSFSMTRWTTFFTVPTL